MIKLKVIFEHTHTKKCNMVLLYESNVWSLKGFLMVCSKVMQVVSNRIKVPVENPRQSSFKTPKKGVMYLVSSHLMYLTATLSLF